MSLFLIFQYPSSYSKVELYFSDLTQFMASSDELIDFITKSQTEYCPSFSSATLYELNINSFEFSDGSLFNLQASITSSFYYSIDTPRNMEFQERGHNSMN